MWPLAAAYNMVPPVQLNTPPFKRHSDLVATLIPVGTQFWYACTSAVLAVNRCYMLPSKSAPWGIPAVLHLHNCEVKHKHR